MPKHKLDFGAWPESTIHAFGIYSDLQVLSLVYQLNKHSLFNFSRLEKDLCKNNTKANLNFILFGFSNKELEIEYRLLENKSYHGERQEQVQSSLFDLDQRAEGLALSNKEGFNYILWLESEDSFPKEVEALKSALSAIKAVKIHQELSELQIKNLKKILNN